MKAAFGLAQAWASSVAATRLAFPVEPGDVVGVEYPAKWLQDTKGAVEKNPILTYIVVYYMHIR